MRSTKKRRVRKVFPGRTIALSKARLDALVEEATVDAYNEAEQVLGLFTMMEDNLRLPFETEIFGLKVTVERTDMTDSDQIVAVCKRSGKRQKVPFWIFRCGHRSRRERVDCGLPLLARRSLVSGYQYYES